MWQWVDQFLPLGPEKVENHMLLLTEEPNNFNHYIEFHVVTSHYGEKRTGVTLCVAKRTKRQTYKFPPEELKRLRDFPNNTNLDDFR